MKIGTIILTMMTTLNQLTLKKKIKMIQRRISLITNSIKSKISVKSDSLKETTNIIIIILIETIILSKFSNARKKNYDNTYKTWNHDKNFDLVDDELCKEVEKIEESNYTKDDNNKEKYSYNYYKSSGQVYQNNVKKVFKNNKRYYKDNTQNDQQQFRNNYNQEANGYKNYNKSNFKNKDNFDKNYKQNNHYYNDYSQDNQHGKKQREINKNNFKSTFQ
jgi:hypothetical protein